MARALKQKEFIDPILNQDVFRDFTIFQLDEAVVGVDVHLPVLEHDDLLAVLTLLCP